jgi:hypothetical protein
MRILISYVAVFAISASERAVAQRPARGPATPQAFGDLLVRVSRANDPVGRERLMHPAVLACSSGENRIYLERMLRLERQDAASDTGRYQVHVTDVGPNPSKFGLPDSLFEYAVPPMKQIEVEFFGPTGTTTGVNILFVAQTPSGWFEVVPCPKPGGAAWLREQEQMEQRMRAHADSLAMTISPTLRAKLLSLMRQNRRLDAANQYHDASGQDLDTAMLVLDALARATKP